MLFLSRLFAGMVAFVISTVVVASVVVIVCADSGGLPRLATRLVLCERIVEGWHTSV